MEQHKIDEGKGREEKRRGESGVGELSVRVCEVNYVLYLTATEHAQRALELDDSVSQSHQWYAIALGTQVKHEGTQKRLAAGHEYKVGVSSSSRISLDYIIFLIIGTYRHSHLAQPQQP